MHYGDDDGDDGGEIILAFVAPGTKAHEIEPHVFATLEEARAYAHAYVGEHPAHVSTSCGMAGNDNGSGALWFEGVSGSDLFSPKRDAQGREMVYAEDLRDWARRDLCMWDESVREGLGGWVMRASGADGGGA